MAGGREFQLVWLKGKYIIYLPGQKRVIFGGCMSIDILTFYIIYIRVLDFFYLECGIIKIK